MLAHSWDTFRELLTAPFSHPSLVWGIVPLYFTLLLNELTPSKATYRTAIQTGFSFVWAAAQWLYPYLHPGNPAFDRLDFGRLATVNVSVSILVLALGLVALFSGLRRRFPKYASCLGHTRFSSYFMILLFPMQAHCLHWSWDRLAAIGLFALPVWLTLHFGLMPLRGRA